MARKTGKKPSDFAQVTTNIQNTEKLFYGRIDLTVQSKSTLGYTCEEAGFTPNEVEAVFVLDKKSLYYAFHGDTSDAVIGLIQEAFDDLKNKGVVADIFRKYGKE